MGVVRNENTLLNGIQTVQALTGNLPLLGMAVQRALLQESRGAHYWREIILEINDDYLKTSGQPIDGDDTDPLYLFQKRRDSRYYKIKSSGNVKSYEESLSVNYKNSPPHRSAE